VRLVRQRGGIAVLIAHRPSALAQVNLVAVMREGRVETFGPRDEVLAKIMSKPAPGQDISPDTSRVPPTIDEA
jgi:ATP-binding cassette subfamily C protein PrsD